MSLAQLLLVSSVALPLAVLPATSSSPSSSYLLLSSSSASELWSALLLLLEQRLTPFTLFFLLNFVIGMLLLTSRIVNRRSHREPYKQKAELKQKSERKEKTFREEKTKARVSPAGKPGEKLPPDPSPSSPVSAPKDRSLGSLRLAKSKSEIPATLSAAYAGHRLHHRHGSDHKKNKKREGAVSPSSSSLQYFAAAATASPPVADSESLRKIASAPAEEINGGFADDEVDRKADEYISQFYLKMKMQRLESMRRYKHGTDQSYGR